MGIVFLALALGLVFAAGRKSSSASENPPLPDGLFGYTEEDEGDLLLEEDDYTYEGSGYGDMPVAQMRSIQFYLQELDFYDGELHGRFTDRTMDAISEFQQWVELPMTGEPDPTTLSVLSQVISNEPAPAPAPEPEPEPAPLPPAMPGTAPNLVIETSYYAKNSFPNLDGVPFPRVVVRGNRVSLESKVAAVLPFADMYPNIWFVVYQYDSSQGFPQPITNVYAASSYNQWTSGNASKDSTLGPKIQESIDLLSL